MTEKAISIAEIRDPNLFQRLVSKLLLAEHGTEYQVVDDSGGDGGLDGFLRTSGDLYACYCPEKPETANYNRKIQGDLRKAQKLRDQSGYPIRRFIFVTPSPLREPSQRLLRDAAKALGFEDGINVADEYLEVVLTKHPALQNQFPALTYPRVAEALTEISAGVQILLDSLSPSPRTAGASSNATSRTTAHSSYSRGLFSDVDLSELTPIGAALLDNAPDALFQLEQFRLACTCPKLATAATMVEMRHAMSRIDHAAVEAAAERGALEARIAGLPAAEAAFRAEIAGMLVWHASQLDREIEWRKKHFSLISQFPFFFSLFLNRRDSIRVVDLYKRVDAEIQSALALARESMNLDALHAVLRVMVYAESTKVDSPGMLARSDIPKERYIDRARRSVKTAHETSIRTARLMGALWLAEAYKEYSLDLMVLFKDVDRSLYFADRMLEAAQQIDDPERSGPEETASS